ncbi:MAG: CPBP family intramembrane glutamic endopeptidase, partial [Terriglobia bacterium]
MKQGEKLHLTMTDSERSKPIIRDIIISIMAFFLVGTVLYMVLKPISFIPREILNNLSVLVAIIIAICLLNQKYPLDWLLRFNIKFVSMYVLPALFVCLLIYTPRIWSDYAVASPIPQEYKIFSELGFTWKIIFLVDFCLLGPITEELFARGFVYRILKNRYSILWAVVISSVVFQILHGFSIYILLNLRILLVSLVFTYVY